MIAPYNQSIKFKSCHISPNDCCPLLHLLTLLTTFDCKKLNNPNEKIKTAFQYLSKSNPDQISTQSFEELFQFYSSNLMDTPHGKSLIQFLLSKITKSLRPSVTVELLQILAQQYHRNKQFQLQTKSLYEAFQIGLLMKKKSFRTFNFGVRACQTMHIKQFEKNSNCVIAALRHQIESNAQVLLKNISQASKVYGLKIKSKEKKRQSLKENKKEFLKKVFQRSSPKGRNYSHHVNQKDFIETRQTDIQKSSSKKHNKNNVFTNSTIKILNKNQPTTESLTIDKVEINNSQQEQRLARSRLTVHHHPSSQIYAKIRSKLRSKSQILPFHILLYEMYSICALRFTSQVKKKYFRDFRTELKEKLIREYPGRNIQQVLFDIQLDKLKIHQMRNDVEWTQNHLNVSSVHKSNSPIEKYFQRHQIKTQNFSKHKKFLSTYAKASPQKNGGHEVREFPQEMSHSAVVKNDSKKIQLGFTIGKQSHQLVNSQLYHKMYEQYNIELVQNGQKFEKNKQEMVQSQDYSKKDGLFKSIRSRKISSKSQHQVLNQKQIENQICKDSKRQNDVKEQQKNEGQMDESSKERQLPIKSTQKYLIADLNGSGEVKELDSFGSKEIQNSEINIKKPLQMKGRNILQRLKKSNMKEKGTLKKKAKQTTQEKNFINIPINQGKISKITILHQNQNNNQEAILVNNQGILLTNEENEFFLSEAINLNCNQNQNAQISNKQEEVEYQLSKHKIEKNLTIGNQSLKSIQTIQQINQSEGNLIKKMSEQTTNDYSNQLDCLVTQYIQIQLQKKVIHQLIDPNYNQRVKITPSQTLSQCLDLEQSDQVINQTQIHKLNKHQTLHSKANQMININNQQKGLLKNESEQLEEQQFCTQVKNFLTQTYELLAITYNSEEKQKFQLQQQLQVSDEIKDQQTQKRQVKVGVNIKHQKPCQNNSQNVISFDKHPKDLPTSQDEFNTLITQTAEQFLGNIQNALLNDSQFLDQLFYDRMSHPQFYGSETQILINCHLESRVSSLYQGQNLPQNKASQTSQCVIWRQSQTQPYLSKDQTVQKPLEIQSGIEIGKKPNKKISINQISLTGSENLIVNQQLQSETHTLRLINPPSQASIPSKSIFYQLNRQANLNTSSSAQLKSQHSIFSPSLPLEQSISIIPDLNLNQQQNNTIRDKPQQPSLRTSLNNPFEEITDLIKSSLINSNNLLGQNLNLSRKSIIKSDSKIKSKNTILSNREQQKTPNGHQLSQQNQPPKVRKAKTVKISMIPRSQTISTNHQFNSITIHNHILKPQLKISESCVTLIIYHPHEKIRFKVERQFTHSINIKDYTKGLHSRITKLLDSIISESLAASEHTLYKMESTSKFKNHKKKKTLFERHEVPQGSVINWEDIIERVNQINLEPQMINLKSMKIEFKKNELLTVCLMHYVDYNRIIIEYKKNPIELRPVQISVDLNESVEDVRSLFNEKNVKIELIDINNEIKATLQVYNLWCHVQTISISLKNSSSKLKAVFKLYQFVFRTKEAVPRYNMLIKMEPSQGKTQNIIISHLGLEDRNKLLNNLSIVVGYAVKIDNGKSKFLVSGKQIKEFLNML